MSIDVAICVGILIWTGYVAFELHKGMKNNFLFEYQRHHVNYLLNEAGVFLSIPLIILSNLESIKHAKYTLDHIYWQYIYFLSRILPCLFYLITKRNEDCLRCFNKDPSIRYSIYQWTQEEIKYSKYVEPTVFCTIKSIGTNYVANCPDTINKINSQIKKEEDEMNDPALEDILVDNYRPDFDS